MTAPKTYFTITGGRTGTAWLGDFLSQNLGFDVAHEPMGIDDFGLRMPDIRTMRHFNTFGNDAVVQEFWERKFDDISRHDVYAETNHTLAKCGLIENLVQSPLAAQSTLIVLRRDLVKQCVSHLIRHDFTNVTTAWQWYLHPDYPKRLVSPKPFLSMGPLGMAVWYCYEMSARQTYYLKAYGDRLNSLEVDLADITTTDGAKAFLARLNGGQTCVLPPPKNQNSAKPPPDLLEKVSQIFNAVQFDVDAIVGQAMADGFSFEQAEPEKARRSA